MIVTVAAVLGAVFVVAIIAVLGVAFLAASFDIGGGGGRTEDVARCINIRGKNGVEEGFIGDDRSSPAPGSAMPADPSFLLNEHGTSLTCSKLLNNVNRYGHVCGLPSSIIAHWKIDSVSTDGIVYDLASNALHLRAHGSPRLRHDEGRSALWLDGVHDYFALENTASSSAFMRGRVHDGFSVSFWFLQQQQTGGDDGISPRPLVVLRRGHEAAADFVAVTTESGTGRSTNDNDNAAIAIRTSSGGSGASETTGSSVVSTRGGYGKWTQCIAVFSQDTVRLVLSRASLGDVDDRTQEHDLSRVRYVDFDDVTIGRGRGAGGFFRGSIHDVRVHARPIHDDEMQALLHLSGNEARETVTNLEVRGGDTRIGGSANVQHRLHFKDPKMDPTYNWRSNNSDTYFLEKKERGRNRSSLDLTINDDGDERFRILGNACREGTSGCGGPGAVQHEFRADGRAYHKGSLVADGVAQARGNVYRFRGGSAGGGGRGPSLRYSGGEGEGEGGGGGGGVDMRVSAGGPLDIIEARGSRQAFRFDTRNDRFCVGGQCMAAADVQRLTRDVHRGDLRVRGNVRAGGDLRARGNIDVRNPGGGGNHDGGRLRTFYRGTDTHLSLEEYDDNVSYDMKTHADGGDVASLVKTRDGDVYIRNRNGFIKLGRDGTVEDSGYARLCVGETCLEEADLRRLAEASDDLSNLDARFASGSSVAELGDRTDDMSERRRQRREEVDQQMQQLDEEMGDAPEPRDRTLAVIYRHCGFEGPSVEIKREGRYDIDFVRKHVGNDEMSAVRVTDGYQVRLFRHSGFRGNSVTLRGDEGCLVFNSDFANDAASSLIVEKTA